MPTSPPTRYRRASGRPSAGLGVRARARHAAAPARSRGSLGVLLVSSVIGGSIVGASSPAVADEPSRTVIDHFERTSSDGLSTTDTGEAWSDSTRRAVVSVDGGVGRLALTDAGGFASAELASASASDSDTRLKVALDRAPDAGSTYVSVLGRSVSGVGNYRLKLRFLEAGSVITSLVRTIGGDETTLASATVPDLSYVAGRAIQVRLTVTGTAPTTMQAKVWSDGTDEPGDWLVSGSDDSRALQAVGSLAVQAYLSRSSTAGQQAVLIDDLASTLGPEAAGLQPPPAQPVAGGRPGPANTGVPAGTVLTPYWGDLTITTPGAHYDGLDVHGFVTVKAPNVTITRSIIRGGYGTYGVGVGLVTNYVGTGFVIEDSELVPEHPSVSLDAIKGSNYTARRINAHGTVDGAKIHGDNVRVESSWLHDMVDYASDPYQRGGPTHNDGVQVLGGNNIVLVGNTITGASNAAVQVTQDYRAVTNLQLLNNYFDGGNQSVALNAKPLPSLATVTLTGNRFGHNTRYHDCAVVTWGDVATIAAENVWDDTGLPVRVRHN